MDRSARGQNCWIAASLAMIAAASTTAAFTALRAPGNPSLRSGTAIGGHVTSTGRFGSINANSSSAGSASSVGALTSGGLLCAALVAAVTRRRGQMAHAKGGDEEAGWKGAKEWSGLTGSVPNVLDNVGVAKVLPHRYPFLLVDKVVEFEPGKRAVGVKNVTANEPQFTGHFPDLPIMPGVLMVEALAQLGGIVALQPPVSDGQGQFFFAGIDGVKFKRPVVPGDTLVMEMELVKFREKYGIAKMTGRAFVDGQLAVDVKEFTFALVKDKDGA